MPLRRAAEVLTGLVVRLKALGNRYSGIAEIGERSRYQHSVRTGVTLDVPWIRPPILEAVVGVGLEPTPASPAVDVVAIELFQATVQHGSLAREARVCPVLVERENLLHLHRVDQGSRQVVLALRACTHDPVADGRLRANLRLASRERAEPKERVRREAVIAGNDVRE